MGTDKALNFFSDHKHRNKSREECQRLKLKEK